MWKGSAIQLNKRHYFGHDTNLIFFIFVIMRYWNSLLRFCRIFIETRVALWLTLTLISAQKHQARCHYIYGLKLSYIVIAVIEDDDKIKDRDATQIVLPFCEVIKS